LKPKPKPQQVIRSIKRLGL